MGGSHAVPMPVGSMPGIAAINERRVVVTGIGGYPGQAPLAFDVTDGLLTPIASGFSPTPAVSTFHSSIDVLDGSQLAFIYADLANSSYPTARVLNLGSTA